MSIVQKGEVVSLCDSGFTTFQGYWVDTANYESFQHTLQNDSSCNLLWTNPHCQTKQKNVYHHYMLPLHGERNHVAWEWMNLLDVSWKFVDMDKNVSKYPENQQSGAQKIPEIMKFPKNFHAMKTFLKSGLHVQVKEGSAQYLQISQNQCHMVPCPWWRSIMMISKQFYWSMQLIFSWCLIQLKGQITDD